MKIPQLASLTATAALMLHFGSFVQANPMFVEIPPAHNDASATTCADTRITYPAGSGISFGNDTRHVVAWSVPSFASQVNLTLVGPDHVSYLDSFPAEKGAFKIPFVLSNGAQAGEYHVHLTTIGGEQSCEADSSPFEIKASAQPAEPKGDDKSAESHSDKDWDAMLTQLGQYVDKDDDKKAESHKDATPESESEGDKTDYFEAYIKSLDMDYTPYIEKNKDSQSDVVTHKNSADDFSHDDAANPYFTNDDQRTHHTDDANPYFTNDDKRTHTNAHLDAELDQIAHTDSPFFQGAGGPASIKTEKIESGEGDEGWVVDEYPYPANEWLDESDDVVDHSNQGEWIAEELDPSAAVHDNSINDWAGERSFRTPFDHSDVGTWSAEEVDDAPEPKVAMEHPDAVGWVESESSHANDADIPDHSNDGEWHVDEVSFEYDPPHTDKADGDWVETDSTHNDKVVNGWVETESSHRNKAQGDWVETDAAHVDKAGGDWVETDSTHSNKVVNGWVATESKHANKANDGWVETDSTHSNKVVNGWVETESKHANKAGDGWVEADSTHNDKVVNGWVATESKHANKAGDGWVETDSTHSNKVVNGWVATESKHANKAGDGWVEADSTHNDKAPKGWLETESSHSDKAQGDWVETDSVHNDKAQGDWVETDATHADDASRWTRKTTAPHKNGGEWQEQESEHKDASEWQAEASDDQHYDDNVLIYAAEDFIN